MRTESGITQVQLGKLLGVTDSAVRLWETHRREPDFAMLCKIAQAFQVSTDFLLGQEDFY